MKSGIGQRDDISSLWDYTPAGLVSDTHLFTGINHAVAPAGSDNLPHPVQGTGSPNHITGPFVLYGGANSIPVDDKPGGTQASQLPKMCLVKIKC